MKPLFINPAIHKKCTTERDIRFCQTLKAKSIRFLMRANSEAARVAGYPVLQIVCWKLDEDCPPLAWFPYQKNLKKGS